MTVQIVPVLLAGGAGTRLWPVSRDALPKQFLPLVGERSTYQETLLRVQGPMFAPPIVITGPDFHFLARRQAEEVGVDAKVVIEPLRRDSAPAIAAASAVAAAKNPEALVLALAADHIILDPEAFRQTCVAGCAAAQAGSIVTFGIRPTEPKTSYGYILPGAEIGTTGVQKVTRFVEKPDASTAARYLLDGYLWNSGNFLFRADVLLSELSRLEPEMAAAIESAVAQASEDLGFLRLNPAAFASIVHSDARLTTLIGVKDLVVVATPDAVLVVPRARSQEVRELVAKLKASKRSEATVHRRVHRPWGYYESIDAGDRFQVKRIVVSPGGVLSLQKHKHRAEHWVVVCGTAEVTIDDKTRSVHENESIYIPIGSVHRLANQGRIPLELIEVQTGSYLGEDDIVRLEDVYRRG
jgi:mannose-1-phosphate guanylyltransferase/mannose-6-phosphate isomerase-like protein (cupin superfamily)